MNENYVTLSLKTYDELKEKANWYDKYLKEVRNQVKKTIDGLPSDLFKISDEKEEVESCQETK